MALPDSEILNGSLRALGAGKQQGDALPEFECLEQSLDLSVKFWMLRSALDGRNA